MPNELLAVYYSNNSMWYMYFYAIIRNKLSITVAVEYYNNDFNTRVHRIFKHTSVTTDPQYKTSKGK